MRSGRNRRLDGRITRRDFLDGVLMTGAALSVSAPAAEAAPALTPYPPARTGLRGAHVGSFEAIHRLARAGAGRKLPAGLATGESYDLVVVGAGISGLTAAWEYRKARPRASILILDNHDDFGGHAKRNELGAGRRGWRIGHGGSQSISSPLPYSATAKALIAELGIRVEDYHRHVDWGIYRERGLGQGFFFDRETFGSDRLVTYRGRPENDLEMIARAPLLDQARTDLARLRSERLDPWPGESEAVKRQRLARLSYARFLLDVWKVDPSVLPLMQTRTHGLYGVGIDAVPAQDANGLGLPGFQGLGLGPQAGPGQNYDSIRSPEAADYFFHFPDGNATVARLLVRRLIPAAMPGRSVEDVITSRAEYRRLDVMGERTRIRLRAQVLGVRHEGPAGTARRLEITYQRGQTPRSVRASRVVLACWHSVIPHICPELPAEQKSAMAYGIKIPVVYTNVALRNWQAWQRLGISRATAPGFWHTSMALDFPVSIGGYRFSRSPEEPIVVRMSKAACRPGLPVREQHRIGRQELLETPFATIEGRIRSDLDRLLGPGGFDAGLDITAITVNRWPHGYTYQYNSLDDPFWLEGGRQPCEIARQAFGRIAIANADSGAYAYLDAAIDHGLRAAREALAMG
jgi:spermidine dehydrogenase